MEKLKLIVTESSDIYITGDNRLDNYIPPEEKTEAIVLVDNRNGNSNQAIALAKKLGISYKIIKIEYNGFAKLPSIMLSLFPVHIKSPSLQFFKSIDIPKVIIAAGRRLSSLALYLKKLSHNDSKIIQIMRPGAHPEEFDMVILPQHDYLHQTLPNIIRTIGALNNVKDGMPDDIVNFKLSYPEVKDFIAVVVGGSSKNYRFNQDDSKELLDKILRIKDQHSLPLFVTFSRRTPHKTKTLFKENITWPSVIYDPDEGGKNPYPAILGLAQFIILTADSISMSSEAASTGKPLYVFCPQGFRSKKHLFFLQQLIDLDIAKKLENDTIFLEKYEYTALDEISRISEIIKNKIL